MQDKEARFNNVCGDSQNHMKASIGESRPNVTLLPFSRIKCDNVIINAQII